MTGYRPVRTLSQCSLLIDVTTTRVLPTRRDSRPRIADRGNPILHAQPIAVHTEASGGCTFADKPVRLGDFAPTRRRSAMRYCSRLFTFAQKASARDLMIA